MAEDRAALAQEARRARVRAAIAALGREVGLPDFDDTLESSLAVAVAQLEATETARATLVGIHDELRLARLARTAA
ncbi:hypothetical protein [Roseomonas elaeocarpi]|uniref:Uncharacterized protein n=1 Tax=Roseomonas elaeocarpi TaxID=907779 RepID=A0ABV6JYY8_9PROT